MIKDRNISDDAMIQVHKIMGSAGMLMTGELFWVGDSGDAAYNLMSTRIPQDRLYTDLDTCVGACVANRGDTIVLMEGYNKTVSAAAALDLDVSGIRVIFLGEGTTKAKITFDTAVTADMDIDATNITLVNPKFVAGIDSLQGPIDVNATDFTMINAEYHDATDIETIDAVIATSGATRLKIDGYKYFCGTETGDLKQSHIQLNGCDDIDMKNIDIRGDFFVGCIENVTDQVLNARMENVYCENLNTTPKPALFLNANATGSMKNVKLKIASGTTYVSSVGKVSWDDRCEGFMGDGYAGEPLGTVLGSGIEGKVDTIASDLVVADALIDAEVIKTATIASDLVVTNAIVDTIASDLVVADALIDGEVIKTATIASDLVVLDAIVDGEVIKTATIASDLVVTNAIVDTIASDLVVLDAIVDGEVIKTATIASDLVVTNAIIDTIASDIVVLDPIIDTIASDLIVADGVIDKIYSDTAIILSDLTVFIAKYTSDVP